MLNEGGALNNSNKSPKSFEFLDIVGKGPEELRTSQQVLVLEGEQLWNHR